MTTVTAAEISARLFGMLSWFTGDIFAGKVLHIRDNKALYEKTKEDFVSLFDDAARAYAEIVCKTNFDRDTMINLAVIADPACAYALYNIVSDSVKLLNAQGEDISYTSPKSDNEFFLKFAFFSLN